jgi:Gram-negative bacterial TonB protein C-terminal
MRCSEPNWMIKPRRRVHQTSAPPGAFRLHGRYLACLRNEPRESQTLPVAQIRGLDYKHLSLVPRARPRQGNPSPEPVNMRNPLGIPATILLLIAVAVIPANTAPAKDADFTPPDIATAGDIPFPPNSIAVGVVTLSLRLDATGKVQSVAVQRDIPSLTSPVQTAIQNWTFTPATRKGSAVPSRISVSTVFQPSQLTTTPDGGMNFAPPQPSPSVDRYVPPQITSASFAVYPMNSIGAGTVVLDVTVDESGNVADVRAIQKVPSLTAPSIAAVKTWGFSAASDHGNPVAARVIVAFVFQQMKTFGRGAEPPRMGNRWSKFLLCAQQECASAGTNRTSREVCGFPGRPS